MVALEEKAVDCNLWMDESPASQELKKELISKGYKPKMIFTGSAEPIFQWGNNFYSGYGVIRTLFT